MESLREESGLQRAYVRASAAVSLRENHDRGGLRKCHERGEPVCESLLVLVCVTVYYRYLRRFAASLSYSMQLRLRQVTEQPAGRRLNNWDAIVLVAPSQIRSHGT